MWRWVCHACGFRPQQNRQAHRLTPALEMYTSALASSVKALHLSPDASAALALALLDSRTVRDDAADAATELNVTLPPVGEVRLTSAAVKFHNLVNPPRWWYMYALVTFLLLARCSVTLGSPHGSCPHQPRAEPTAALRGSATVDGGGVDGQGVVPARVVQPHGWAGSGRILASVPNRPGSGVVPARLPLLARGAGCGAWALMLTCGCVSCRGWPLIAWL